MIDISFEDISEWYGNMLEQKYRDQFEVLKKTFYCFYNLTNQISILYQTIYKQSKKLRFEQDLPQHIKDEQIAAFQKIIHRSLNILAKMCQTKQYSIERSTCDKFIYNFQLNLNVLCTYYHSLGHCDLIRDKFTNQKKKIVAGINSLYAFHTRIRDLYKNQHFNELKAISQQKKAINNSRKIIMQKIQNLESKQFNMESLYKNMSQLYEQFLEATQKIEQSSPPLKKIMMSYLKILQQFYEAQAELQYLLMPFNEYCDELKQKKKNSPLVVVDSVNNFTRISTQLLKSNYSIKTIKKIKIQQFSKCLNILFDQLILQSIPVALKDSKIDSKIEQIIEITGFMIECIKQIEKVENSGMISTIKQCQQKLYPHDHKKKITKMIEYQKYMSQYYQVQELIKNFTLSVRQMALKQFGIKVNLIFDKQVYKLKSEMQTDE